MIRGFINKITSREKDPINRARILMLFYLGIAYIVFSLFLTTAYLYYGPETQLIRAVLIFIFAISFLLLLYFKGCWRTISHVILILITFMGAWSNLLFFVGRINVATLQYIWLASALGFYMLGSRWGWFYAILNIVPVLLDAVSMDNNALFLGATIQPVHKPIYIFVLIYDFGLIIFLHYYFFKSFNKTFIRLTQAKNQLNDMNLTLQRTVEEVKELSNTRMNFLSTMSHELRTPLNGVIGLSNVLLLQKPRKDQEETLAALKFSAENLLSLINDILDFNKLYVEKVELEKTPFSLTELIAQIYGSTKVKAQEKHLDFEVEVDEKLNGKTLFGDQTRLTQVLLNLIDNAIKFTEKGKVALSAEMLNQDANEISVRFSIADTGIGIAQEQQKDIFEDFVQASASTTRNYGGTGLGLPIVKRVLQLFGSTIRLDSILGQGTVFSFDINFEFSSNVKGKTEMSVPDCDAEEGALFGLKVLVVEDNPINTLVIEKILHSFSIWPDFAENGKVALEKVKQGDYDLILMDLYMPEMDGYEATRNIRGLAGLGELKKAKVPIIALTATVNQKVIEEVHAVGMNDYLAKPFHPKELFTVLSKCVSIKN